MLPKSMIAMKIHDRHMCAARAVSRLSIKESRDIKKALVEEEMNAENQNFLFKQCTFAEFCVTQVLMEANKRKFKDIMARGDASTRRAS